MDLRKGDVLLTFGEENSLPVVLKKCLPLDFDRVQPLPDLRHSLSRVYTLKSENHPDPVWTVAKELWYDWIYINLPPVTEINIKKKLDKHIQNLENLKKTNLSKRGPTWETNVRKLLVDLDNGFDLRSRHQASIDILTEEFEIVVGEDEELLYQDNCVPGEDGKCPRLRACAGEDLDWLNDANERREKMEKKDEKLKSKIAKIKADKAALAKLKVADTKVDLDSVIGADNDIPEIDNNNAPDFKVHPRDAASRVVPGLTGSVSTRSSSSSFPVKTAQRAVRTSYKHIDIDVIEAMVSMESQFGVEQRQVAPLLSYVMNKLAGQKWEPPTEESEKLECGDIEDDPRLGKRKKVRDLTFVLPSRKCLHKKLEDAAMLNFQHVAETVAKTQEEGGTVTLGWDDTVKASGHRVHDVKSGRVTCVTTKVDEEGKEKRVRQSLTTGFLPNISHSGSDSATAVRSSISQMAVLCSVQYEEMADFIDFWMNDRAGDGDKMLDELGVSEEHRLKCNAHCILCIQNAADKVFKDKETEIGVAKLISTDAQHVFNSPSNSIFTLGLIAFAKFLSPSHAQCSISLYKDYKVFLAEDSKNKDSTTQEMSAKLLKMGFLGFSSNRFGRTLELAETFLQHRSLIEKFYDEQVDQNQNKLFLACYAYLNSSWFKLCCQIGSKVNTTVVIPIKAALGIDKFQKSKSELRSWSGMKRCFSDLLKQISEASTKTQDMSGTALLEAEVFAHAYNALKHQLDYMKFFQEGPNDDPISEIQLKKMDEAPLTNSGCESNFAQLDLECRRGSGQTTLQTMSNRNMVKTNQYFNTEEWKQLSPELRAKSWKDARSGEAAKIVRSMQQDFLNKVKAAESLARQAKISKKAKKNEKCLKLLEEVKDHGGPITPNDIHKLDLLTDSEILTEVRYLRQTVAPNIREKRKVDRKFLKFSKSELIQQIKSVLKPENEEIGDINTLLMNSLKLATAAHDQSAVDVVNEGEELAGEVSLGTVAIFEGPLGERKVGVVLTKDTLQFYQPSRYGFEPEDLTSEICDWKITTTIEDFDFISRRTGVYLRCSLRKKDL